MSPDDTVGPGGPDDTVGLDDILGPDGRDDTVGPDGRDDTVGPDGRDDKVGPGGRDDTVGPGAHSTVGATGVGAAAVVEHEVHASLEPFRVGLRTPVTTARGVVFDRSGWVVVLRAGSCWGRGEVAPLPGWSAIDADQARSQLDGWIRASTGGSPAPADDLAPEVRAGIGAAVASLRAALDGVPLWRSLGGVAGTVLVNHLAVGSTPDALGIEVVDLVASGATTVKIKVGMRDDAERLRRLAQVVPPGVQIRLDANGGWSVSEAAAFAEHAVDVLGDRLEYIEDPVAGLADLAALRTRSRAPVAIDEGVRSADDLAVVLADGLAEVVVVKPPLVGGIVPTAALARAAAHQGIDVVVSSLYDGPVGLAAWCHLAAALGGRRAHGLGTAPLLDGGVAAHLVPRRDRIELPG